MRLLTLQRRSLIHHWRAHLPVMLGVAVGTAVLTGALLVGDSLRGSLRETALHRVGRITHAVQSPRFFREALAEELEAEPEVRANFQRVIPVILVRASIRHAERGTRLSSVTVFALDDPALEPAARRPATQPALLGRAVRLNRAVADALGARPGDEILLKLPRPAAIPAETLLGRRDDALVALRLTVAEIVREPYADFSLEPRQAAPQNAFVPLRPLQRALGGPGQVNTLLFATRHGIAYAGQACARDATLLQALLERHVTLPDCGLKLRVSREHGYVALESDSFLLPPVVEAAARATAAGADRPITAVLAYLANSITDENRPGRAIPYSTVAALSPDAKEWGAMESVSGALPAAPGAGEIVLNEWAARELGAQLGDPVRLTYYVAGPLGELDSASATFRLSGVVRLSGAAADPGFTPEYPGVTDADSLAGWHPPFPIDLTQIRQADEDYWRAHGATPKAFVTLADGQRLWTAQPERFGQLTALRVYAMSDVAGLERELLAHLDPAELGLRVENIRGRMLAASRGSTDFSSLFVGFSFFLIVSAALLVALLFRLGVERRAGEVGLLLATGFPPRRVARLLLSEGALVTVVGVLVGLMAARGYAWLMLTGLRSWWSGAAHAPFLQLHATALSQGTGAGASLVVALVSIAWSLRGITRRPPRALLTGVIPSGPQRKTGTPVLNSHTDEPHERARPRAASPSRDRQGAEAGALVPARGSAWRRMRAAVDPGTRFAAPGAAPRVVAVLAAALGGALVALSLTTNLVSQTTAFFAGGSALLSACLAGLYHWLRSETRPHGSAGSRRPPAPRQVVGLLRLGMRNARRHVGRSLLTAGLIAVATFVIAALEALRLPVPDARARESGTGGFALLAEATVPVVHDLNTPTGRAALGLSDSAADSLAGATFVPFRLRAGDEASCLNLYRPGQPRLLGATDAMIERGGFTFAATLAHSDAERQDPWTLLRRPLPDGAVPAIADEAAALWQLHINLGDELHTTDERGRDVRLRLVALLRGSVLQGELLVHESHFTRLFPSITGYWFFLIDVPPDRAAAVERTLECDLSDFGFSVTPTTGRLADLFAVQNTYLSTFQTLGGLGLLLGTVGLTAVLLRNVWERRAELALLRTLGFTRRSLGGMVLMENAFLVAVGLLAGVVSAAVVVAPHVATRATSVPWASLLLMFAGVFAAGLLAGVVALGPALRGPLLPALRSE